MKTIDMTHGNPLKLLIQFSIPVLLGNLFQQIYTLADRIIVGQFVGDKAFSAVGATTALSMMYLSMCMGAAIGIGVVVSQYFGAKDEKNTASAIANGSYTCIIVAVIMTIIALLTTKPILSLLNTPDSIMGDAVAYMYIYGRTYRCSCLLYTILYSKSYGRLPDTTHIPDNQQSAEYCT